MARNDKRNAIIKGYLLGVSHYRDIGNITRQQFSATVNGILKQAASNVKTSLRESKIDNAFKVETIQKIYLLKKLFLHKSNYLYFLLFSDFNDFCKSFELNESIIRIYYPTLPLLYEIKNKSNIKTRKRISIKATSNPSPKSRSQGLLYMTKTRMRNTLKKSIQENWWNAKYFHCITCGSKKNQYQSNGYCVNCFTKSPPRKQAVQQYRQNIVHI